jgi:allantoin racemase
MKILDVIPVNYDIIDYAMQAYLEEPLHQLGSNGTTAEHDRLYDGQPSIECSYDEVVNAQYAYKIVDFKETTYSGEFNACFINCFGDPGVSAARCRAEFPVFGGFEPSVLIAMSLADRIGIITVLDNVMPILHEHVNNAYFGGRIVSLRNVNIPVLGLEDHTLLIQRLTDQALEAIAVEHAEAFVLGCTGMLEVAQAVEANLARAGYTVPVIEPGQAAMVMCELLGNLGYKHSRKAFPKQD